jgi:tetratricopeptide (TPR) repeat protein
LAAGVRAGYLKGFQESPFSDTPLGEAVVNVNWAKAIETAGTLGDEPLTRPPLYPLLLSLAVRAGDEATLARGVHAATGVAVACLIFLAGRTLLGVAGGLLAGLFFALYGPSLYHEAQLVATSLLLFTFVCYWLAALQAWRRGSILLWFISGILLGAMAGLSIGAFTLALPALLLAGRRSRKDRSPRLGIVLPALLIGALLPIVPFVIHNGRNDAPGVVVAQDGGIRFYMANNPHATGLPPSMAGEATWWHGDRYARAEAAVKSGGYLGPSQISHYWFLQGLRFIFKEPGSYIKLLGRKLAHFWGSPELVSGPSPAFVAGNWAPWSKPLMYAFALLGSLSLAGVVLFRKNPEAWAMAFPLIGALAFALVYTSEATARLLAAPSVAILASALLLHLAGKARTMQWKSLSTAIVLLLCALFVVNVFAPWASGAKQQPARDHRLLGAVYETQGKGTLALDQYDKAARMSPRNSLCRLSLAAMLASDGVADEAERHFLAAAALDSLSPAPYLGLANLYRRNGLYEQALSSLEKAVIRAPYDVGLAVSLGRSCIEMGLYERAEAHFRSALSVDPENASAIDGLLELRDRGVYVKVQESREGSQETVRSRMRDAMQYLRAGDLTASKTILDELTAEVPDDLDVVFALATWHLAAGNPDQAIEGYERCYENNPRNPLVMNNLATAYHQVGRVDEAISMWQRVLALDPNNIKAKSNLERALSESGEVPSE